MSFLKKLFSHGNGTQKLPPHYKFKNVKIAEDEQAALELGIAHIDAYIQKGVGRHSNDTKLSELDSWAEIKKSDETTKAALCTLIISERLEQYYVQQQSAPSPYLVSSACEKLPQFLMRKTLPFSEGQLIELISHLGKQQYFSADMDRVVKAAGHYLTAAPLTPSFQSTIKRLLKKAKQRADYYNTKDLRKLVLNIEALGQDSTSIESKIVPGAFSKLVLADVKNFDGGKAWDNALIFFQTATGSTPSAKWLKTAKTHIDELGEKTVEAQFRDWLDRGEYTPQYPDPSLDLAKGMIWASACLSDESMSLYLGQLAQHCYVKVTGWGPRSKLLGNACTVALARMATPAAISELIRLRDKNKYPSTKTAIEKKLAKIAETKNISLADLEAKSLPDFGFDVNGRFEKTMGGFSALIQLTPSRAHLQWFGEDGKPRKTIPKALRDNFKNDVSELKKKAKDMTAVIAGQLTALEQSWLNALSWPAPDWQVLYLEHPIRAQMTRSLIWSLRHKDKTTAFMAEGEKLIDLSGAAVKLPKDGIITLWHPVNAAPSKVLQWRKSIESRTITQPIRQAHREVYVLTDAERNTDIYSNRFAAHVVRQYQFKALCTARFWHYTLQGQWDSYNIPIKTLRAHNMTVEYHVEAAVEDEVSDLGIYMYLATDQVRFFGEDRAPLHLADIPPIVFSEVMRDVDLFVAVTSVANDPNWTDGGPDGRFGQYWIRHSFGELGETAKMRKTLIEGLVPKLAIKDKLNVTDKYLEVQGRKHNYQIHFGSGNVMIMPDNRYLCIVRGGKSKNEDEIYLPFEGDTMLSVILSKAMLLVNDHKIKDKTILNQLRR